MFNLTPSFIEDCISAAEKLESKLPENVYHAPGLSNGKVRNLLNNLCSFSGTKYLNVGLFTGSSFWSAIFHNNIKATGIDFWRGGVAAKCDEINFWKNLGNILSCETKDCDREINIINQDCFTVELKDKYNVYFYDADHSQEGQYKAITYFDKFMEDKFIMITDDYDDEKVRNGTVEGIEKMSYEVLYHWEGKGNFGNWSPVENKNWWNGIAINLLKKTNICHYEKP